MSEDKEKLFDSDDDSKSNQNSNSGDVVAASTSNNNVAFSTQVDGNNNDGNLVSNKCNPGRTDPYTILTKGKTQVSEESDAAMDISNDVTTGKEQEEKMSSKQYAYFNPKNVNTDTGAIEPTYIITGLIKFLEKGLAQLLDPDSGDGK